MYILFISNLCITKLQLTNLCSFACSVFCYVTGQGITPPSFYRFPFHFPRRTTTQIPQLPHTRSAIEYHNKPWGVGEGLLAAEPKCELNIGQNKIPAGNLTLTLNFKSKVTGVTVSFRNFSQKITITLYKNILVYIH